MNISRQSTQRSFISSPDPQVHLTLLPWKCRKSTNIIPLKATCCINLVMRISPKSEWHIIGDVNDFITWIFSLGAFCFLATCSQGKQKPERYCSLFSASGSSQSFQIRPWMGGQAEWNCLRGERPYTPHLCRAIKDFFYMRWNGGDEQTILIIENVTFSYAITIIKPPQGRVWDCTRTDINLHWEANVICVLDPQAMTACVSDKSFPL